MTPGTRRGRSESADRTVASPAVRQPFGRRVTSRGRHKTKHPYKAVGASFCAVLSMPPARARGATAYRQEDRLRSASALLTDLGALSDQGFETAGHWRTITSLARSVRSTCPSAILEAVTHVHHAVDEVLGPSGRLLPRLARVGIGPNQADGEVGVHVPVDVEVDFR